MLPILVILNTVISISIALTILIVLFKASTSPKIPQSPATCGIAFFIATAGTGSYLHLLSLIPNENFYLVASAISLPLLCTASGYVAARTAEDTAAMNTKIVAALALFPFFIITYFAFMSQPSWINYYAVLIFIPCIFLGFALNPTHSKHAQSTAESDHDSRETLSPYD